MTVKQPIIYSDICYSNTHPLNTYDLYLPSHSSSSPPILIFIHGGAWVSGDKKELTTMAINLSSSQNIAVALLNYRLSERNINSEIQHPLHSIDCLLGYLHIVENGRGLGYDSKNIYLGGHSAGGQLSGMIGLRVGDIIEEMEKKGMNGINRNDIVEKVAHIKGIIVTEGIFDLKGFSEHDSSYKNDFLLPAFGKDLLKDDWKLASPMCSTKEKLGLIPYIKLPKYILFYSNQDNLVKKSQSLDFGQHLHQLGFTRVELILDDFGTHDEVPISPIVLKLIAKIINQA
ncbi:alpha/beta-hydrolase [Neoconidiobolus thromboides FSU 785]|nr:alpha/beta-hydrolase [Neoconidiobolus thromboides FSU 785]